MHSSDDTQTLDSFKKNKIMILQNDIKIDDGWINADTSSHRVRRCSITTALL